MVRVPSIHLDHAKWSRCENYTFVYWVGMGPGGTYETGFSITNYALGPVLKEDIAGGYDWLIWLTAVNRGQYRPAHTHQLWNVEGQNWHVDTTRTLEQVLADEEMVRRLYGR